MFVCAYQVGQVLPSRAEEVLVTPHLCGFYYEATDIGFSNKLHEH